MRFNTVTRRSVVVILLVFTIFCVPACQSQKPVPPVARGLADIHNHQLAQYGFGGYLFTHGIDPAGPCQKPVSYSSSSFHLVDMIRTSLSGEAQAQWDDGGKCYPTASNLAGQQVDIDSLRRAWSYGLRLMVVHAVNSEIFCLFTNYAGNDLCRDRESIERQFAAARDLEAKIDNESGGPGRGWYRIVLTPQEARSVIGEGKLAVILGVEAANAFGCHYYAASVVDGVDQRELAYQLACGDEVDGSSRALALALFEHYWDLGARHFFPVHNLDGLAGGTGLGIPILHAHNHPSRLKPGSPFNKVPAIDRTIESVRPPFRTLNCATVFDFDKQFGDPAIASCNAQGLSADGRWLVKLMADYGAMIDIDHMSLKMKNAIMFDADGIGPYPLSSSHSGMNEINHLDHRNEGQLTPGQIDQLIKYQGVFGPILIQSTSTQETDTYPPDTTTVRHRCGGTTETFAQGYRYIVAKLRSGRTLTGAPAFVGVAFGSDFNGLAGWPRPRLHLPYHIEGGGGIEFWRETLKEAFIGPSEGPPPGSCWEYPSTTEPTLSYPFVSPMTGLSFQRQVLSWSGRTRPYDISTDGVANIGMIPDMIEELRAMGLSNEDIEPLWNGAEAYIRTWEAALSWSGTNSKEHSPFIRDACRQLRSVFLQHNLGQDTEIGTISQMRQLGCHGFGTPVSLPTATVPNVVGLNRNEAERRIAAVNLCYKATFPFSANGQGLADTESPAAGTVLQQHSVITVSYPSNQGPLPDSIVTCP